LQVCKTRFRHRVEGFAGGTIIDGGAKATIDALDVDVGFTRKVPNAQRQR
jgi:hypothetical protein